MYFFIGLALFSPWTHGKPGVAPVWHIVDSGIAKTLQPSPPEESLKCYRLKVRNVTPVSHALHHMVNHTFQHTFTHIIGRLAYFGGIPLRRWSSPSNQFPMGPGLSSPLDFSARGPN